MVVDIFNTDRKYQTIYADPPWWETGGGKIKRGADRHYQLMKTPEIIALPVPELIDPERVPPLPVGYEQPPERCLCSHGGLGLPVCNDNYLAERQGWSGAVLPWNDGTLSVRNHKKETAV